MVGSVGFVEVVAFIWGILCLILFFKIWGACNNIDKLVKVFIPKSKTPDSKEEVEEWLKGKK